MKKALLVIPMLILMCIMAPFLILGFMWHWIKVSFEGGIEKAESFENYLDNKF